MTTPAGSPDDPASRRRRSGRLGLSGRRDGPLLIRPLPDFLAAESTGGVLLVVSAVAALLWANSPWSAGYDALWATNVRLAAGPLSLELDLRHVVNDVLMTLFFLVAGLEIKREVAEGELRGARRAALPAFAALGGMLVPAGIHLAITAGSDAARGWGIPMATDIALAIGVVTLLGSRVPRGAVLFLLALAIVDDIGAIAVIAVFYSDGVVWGWAAGAGVLLALTVLLRWSGTPRLAPFVVLGSGLWLCLHEAGVHPTLAGVAMGLLAPARPMLHADLVDADELASVLLDVSTVERARETVAAARSSVSVVEWLGHVLHPWTSLVVVPLFALANAGLALDGASLRSAAGSAATWGVAIGMVVGKPLGIVGAVWSAQRLGVGRLPDGVTNRDVLGIAVLAGIGFTVSMLVTSMAFGSERDLADAARVGILAASVLCAVGGAVVLSGSSRQRSRSPR